MYEIFAANKVFSEIFYGSPTPMWVLDAETLKFLAVNDSTVRLYRYSRDEFRKLGIQEIQPPREQAEFEELIRSQPIRAVQSGTMKHIGKNGITIYADITSHRIVFDGHPAWLVMLRDLTEQTIAIQALSEAEKKYRVLVEQSLVGIYTLKGRVISYANPRFAQIFGYADTEVTGKDILEFIAESDKAEALKGLRLRLQGDTSEHLYIRTGRRKDGESITVELRTAQVMTEDGPLIFGFVLDVTEAKLAEEKILAHASQLKRALDQTVGAISTMGELRDPYTAGHEQRTSTIAEAIGKEMGLSSDVLAGIRISSILHDIGKVAVPVEILIKPTRLTPGEYSIIKTHSQWSYNILKDVHFKWPVAAAILQHHERLDGTGYPNGIRDDDLILEARVLTVADVVESMAMNRPYRAGLGVEVALAEINAHVDTRFDREVVAACNTLIREKGFRLPQH